MKFDLGKYSFGKLVERRMNSRARRDHPIRKMIKNGFSKITPNFMKGILPKVSLTPATRKKIQLVVAVFQVIALYAVVMISIIFFFKTLTSINLREPTNAEAVLKGVETPHSTFYTTQIYRAKKIAGHELTRGTLMQALLDTRNGGKYQFTAQGIGHYKNEASYVLLLQTDGNKNYIKLGNTPLGEFKVTDKVLAFPPINQLIPIYAQDLRPLDPKIVDDKATVAGSRGWKISFKPDKEVILRMFLYSFLSNLINMDDNGDFAKIQNGDFETVSANAYITRSPRELTYLDVVIKVDGAKYRLFTQYRLNNNDRIKNLELDNPSSVKSDPFQSQGSLEVIK